MQKLKLKISGLHCSGCALEIDDGLEIVEGVKSAKTNYAKSEVEVEFDPKKVSEKKITETLKSNGYEVVSVN